MRDPYECLSVPPSATADDIKRSFRQLAKKLHPDANNNDPNAAAQFAELNTAHAILADENKRQAFDRGEIDAEGRPTNQLVSLATQPRRSGSSARILMMLALLMFAATSTLLVARLPPQAISNGRDRILQGLGGDERRVGTAQPEPSDGNVQSELRVISQNNASAGDDTIPLGIQVSGGVAGLALEISGLPNGTTISSGRPLGTGGWRLLAADASKATIRPPTGFSGTIDFGVELRLANDTVVDRGLYRLEWTPIVVSAPAKSAGDTVVADTDPNRGAATPTPADENATHDVARLQVDHEQIELLIARSQKLVSEGDVGAARTLLQRAAEAGDARAALALGSTYDPIMLTILQARGVTADAFLARFWYRKASELGSEEAQQRLKLLVSANGGGPVAILRADAARQADPRPKQDAVIATDSAPTKRRVRQLSRVEGSRPDPDEVAQDRVSADAVTVPRPRLIGLEPLIQAMGQ